MSADYPSIGALCPDLEFERPTRDQERQVLRDRIAERLRSQERFMLLMLYRTRALRGGVREWRAVLWDNTIDRGEDNLVRLRAPEGDADFMVTQLDAII